MARQIKLSNQALKQKLTMLHPSDIAVFFEQYEIDQMRIFKLLGIHLFSETFILLKEDTQKDFFKSLSFEQQKSLFNQLDLDDVKTFIERFDVKEHTTLLHLLTKSKMQKVTKLLSYQIGSAGSISSPHYVQLPLDTTVKNATHYVTTQTTEQDEIDVIFFHDEAKKFIGAITLHQLILARASEDLQDLYNPKYPFVFETDKMELALKKIQDYDLEMIPVLNDGQQLIGVITADDALEIFEDIHLETVSELVKLQAFNEDDSSLKRTKNRLPWLLISAILNIVIASFLLIFHETLSAHVALVLFQPMILGMAGNIGTQSISVTILGLQQDEITPKKHIVKEVTIGFLNSLCSGLMGFIVVFIFLNLLPQTIGEVYTLSLTVGISLVISMFVSSLAGVLLPFILRSMGADEKAASGPLISTINDFTALGVYFLVATLLLMSL